MHGPASDLPWETSLQSTKSEVPEDPKNWQLMTLAQTFVRRHSNASPCASDRSKDRRILIRIPLRKRIYHLVSTKIFVGRICHLQLIIDRAVFHRHGQPN